MIPSFAHCEKQQTLNDTNNLKWKNRVLLIQQKQGDSQTLILLKTAKQQIDERHMIWIVTHESGTTSNYPHNISTKLTNQINNEHFTNKNICAVLIGKDGHVKARYKNLDLTKIFALIDTMPMRQREMRK